VPPPPPPHLQQHRGPPAATAAYLYQQNAAAAAAAFPTQLISLHQIRNYAHQPGAAGLIAGSDSISLSIVLSPTISGRKRLFCLSCDFFR